MYWFLYRTRDNSRGFFYDWQPHNLKYTLNAKEAQAWYDSNKELMVKVKIKRPPNIELEVQVPLWNWKLNVNDRDKEFLRFITQWNVDTRMEMVLGKFMNNYWLGKDWVLYRREDNKENLKNSTLNTLNLIIMKEILLGMFRVTPLKVPVGKDKKDLNKTIFEDWDLWDDFSIEYTIWDETFKTNVFWVYTPKLYQAMLPDSSFNWYYLQPWQLDFLLRYGGVNYVIWPRGWGKSIIANGLGSSYLLKELTDKNERIQEFAVLYMGLTQKQNAPYLNYARKMLNNLIELPSFCTKDPWADSLFITDWDKKRSIEYITKNQEDPSRGRRTRFAVADEADYLDWDKLKGLLGTADSIVTLISTIGADTQSGAFYKGWLNAYKEQRDYEPIDQLIHRIWRKYWLHEVTSRKQIQKMVKEGIFELTRAEFLAARPIVALHYTLDDVAFLTEEQKDVFNARSEAVGWYEYMLAENYGEYSTDSSVFKVDGLQWTSPYEWDYVIVGYDEAEQYDYPWLCAVIVKNGEYRVDNTWRLPKESSQKFSKIREVLTEYKGKSASWKVHFVADISRSEAVARELSMLGMPTDMQVRWTGNVDYKPNWWKHLVGKSWCIDMIAETFFASQNFHIDGKCYWEDWLVEEIQAFKRLWKKIQGEKKKNDDQVCAMLLCLYYLWTKEQLWISGGNLYQIKRDHMNNVYRDWATKYQARRDETGDWLSALKKQLF